MSGTVFCEQCGAAIGASASFCASCGSAQAQIAVEQSTEPSGSDTDIAAGPSWPPALAATVLRNRTPQASGPSAPIEPNHPQTPPLPSPSGPTSTTGTWPGRTSRALAHARDAGDNQIVASFWLGWSSFGSTILAFIAKSSALYFIGAILGIAAIVTARFARQRAQAAGDAELVRLSRYGQITGWIVVGLLLAVLLFIAAFFGSFLGSFGH